MLPIFFVENDLDSWLLDPLMDITPSSSLSFFFFASTDSTVSFQTSAPLICLVISYENADHSIHLFAWSLLFAVPLLDSAPETFEASSFLALSCLCSSLSLSFADIS